MKNVILVLALTAGLAACSTTKRTTVQNNPQPAPAPVATTQVAPRAGCNTCGSHSYTVSEPVEVVYKNITYTTVYEPKTYSNTTYVKKPYTCGQGNLCNAQYK